MGIRKLLAVMAMAFAASGLLAASAQASIVFAFAGPYGPVESPNSAFANFNAGAGAGAATFRINGFNTIDGVNCCTDTFTLNLNGVDVLQGAFNMGGGGGNVVDFAPVGATINTFSACGNCGGYTDLYTPLNLINGVNTLTFTYSGAAQGIGDESWGLQDIEVTGNAFNAVPEPASWALMIGGFGLTGAMLRRRRSALALAA